MENFVFIIFLLLCIAVALTVYRRGEHLLKIRLVRIFITVISIVYFAYWFSERSISNFVKDSVVLQIINKLPQALDFYVIKVNNLADGGDRKYELQHSGKVRPEHYRVEYLKMENSEEYWIAGYLGKKNLVYFSQHSVPNKNMDQILEINNYINQSRKLSETAENIINNHRLIDMGRSVWVTLSLLLIFFSIALLIQKK